MKNKIINGLYAITDEHLTHSALLEKTAQALCGGAALIQYRNKMSDGQQRLLEARELLVLCQQHHVPLIINDDIILAKASGADGVHLGRNDETIQQARAALGKQAIIGVSCYNSVNNAVMAESAGADYVAFGSFFTSPTKPDATRASIDILQQAKARLSIPIVAIGGITPHNAASLITAGADAVAVIHGIYGQTDSGEAAKQFARLFNEVNHRIMRRAQQQ